jgi:hypothetical protein
MQWHQRNIVVARQCKQDRQRSQKEGGGKNLEPRRKTHDIIFEIDAGSCSGNWHMRCVTVKKTKKKAQLTVEITIKSLEKQIAGVAEMTGSRRSTDARQTKGSKSWQMTGVAQGLRGPYIAYVG